MILLEGGLLGRGSCGERTLASGESFEVIYDGHWVELKALFDSLLIL